MRSASTIFSARSGTDTNGSGGQLVYHDRGDPNYDEEYERKLNEDDYAQKRRGRASQSKKNIDAKLKRDSLFVMAGILKSVDTHSWYPLSRRYSSLFTIPDDAKDDWKSAVEECKRMLEKDGVDWQSAE